MPSSVRLNVADVAAKLHLDPEDMLCAFVLGFRLWGTS